MRYLSNLYDISYRGNIRGKSKAGFMRPTLCEFFDVRCNFEEINKYYTVSVTKDSNVSVDSLSKNVSPGGTATFTLSFSSGYRLDSVSHGTVSGNTWTIDNITSNMNPILSSRETIIAEAEPGDFVAGGYYVGKMATGSYALIVSPKAQGESYLRWGGEGLWNTTTAKFLLVPTTLSNGYQNTQNMVNSGRNYNAGLWCNNLSINGYNDWYFPAIDELELIYRNLKPEADVNEDYISDVHWEKNGYNPNSDPQCLGYERHGFPYQSTNPAFQLGG